MTTNSVTPVRDAHKAMTRERILDAAIELIAKTGAEPVAIAAVAEGAGVTHRTVYRHFKTRDDLIEAVWPRLQQRLQSKGFPRTAADLVAMPGRLFPRFDENATLVRASAFSDAGLEVRLRANAERQDAMLACVADALPGLDPQAMRRRAAVVQLIDSAYAWAALRDFWGLDGVEAGRAAGEALAVLLGLRDPSDDTPLPAEEERSPT
jgi:AcrR family transcriptional regulator